MKQRTKEASRHVDVVLRALDILECFENDTAISIKQIIDQTGLTRSRAMRLIGTLESRRYIVEDPRTRNFYPGIKLSILGKAFERYNNVEIITRPVIKRVAMETGESATFYVIDGSERVALVREEGTHAIRLSVVEGQRLPIHAGASAKIMLAFGPEELLEKKLANGTLPKITSHTITDPNQLKEEIEKVRKQGYAISKGENIIDANAIAAPVFDFNQELIGAIGIAAPSHRLKDSQIKDRLKIILRAAEEVSAKFGKH